MKLIRIFLLSLTIFVAGCEKKEEEKMKEIELITQTKKVKFLFPPGYVKNITNSSLITILIKYPEITPDNSTTPEARKNQITIFVTATDGEGKTEMLIKNASENFDIDHQGAKFYVGKNGIYDIYQRASELNNVRRVDDIILVFRSKDNVMVGISDTGSAVYTANRKLIKNIDIKYLIPRELNRNFSKIDSDVVNFVKQYIK